MQSKTLSTISLLTILIFASCSNPADTAQVPDMAPVIPQATALQKTVVEDLDKQTQPKKVPQVAQVADVPQVADVLLQQKDLFGVIGEELPSDSFLETQASFEEFESGIIPTASQTDFSQGLILDTK